MRWLFEHTAQTWTSRSADEDRWRGLALFGIDGTTLRVPDTPQNVAEFGRAQSVRGESGYPMIRLVAAMALRSRLLVGVEFGAYAQGS